MKFSTSALLAVAAFPVAMSSGSEYIEIRPRELEAIANTVLTDAEADRRLQSGLLIGPGETIDGVFSPNYSDTCPDGQSRYLVNLQTTGSEPIMYDIELCDGEVEGSPSGSGLFDGVGPDIDLCVADGKNVILTVLATERFGIAIQHINKNGESLSTSLEVEQNVHFNGNGGVLTVTVDNAVGGENTFIQMNTNTLDELIVRAICDVIPFCTPDYEFVGEGITPDDPAPIEGAGAEFTTRIGPNTCGGDTAPDPHFKTFSGDWFDFHGQCDLVLIDVPDYDNETGLAVYIRTTVRYAYSFIETIAVKVGEDIIQVSSWGDYMINGISNAELEGATLNGLPVTREVISDKQFKFVITLANGHHFTIKVFKDMISTHFDIPEEHSVLGLLGNSKGAKLARDGITIIKDANEFGQEWQVQDTDHQLFQTVRAPQFPAQCIMPDPVEREQRRLAATVSQDAAEAACSHVKDEHVRDMCIFDVMSVDDLSLAAGAY